MVADGDVITQWDKKKNSDVGHSGVNRQEVHVDPQVFSNRIIGFKGYIYPWEGGEENPERLTSSFGNFQGN